jgi:hypothetical protein
MDIRFENNIEYSAARKKQHKNQEQSRPLVTFGGMLPTRKIQIPEEKLKNKTMLCYPLRCREQDTALREECKKKCGKKSDCKQIVQEHSKSNIMQ